MQQRMTPDPARVAALTALDRALADPVRLVRLLADAADPDDGAARVAEAFDLTLEQAQVVLDAQLASVTQARRAGLSEEAEGLRTPWGPALHLTATVEGGVASVTVEGRAFVADGDRRRERPLQDLGRLLAEGVARPRRIPVVVSVPGGVRMTVLPDGAVQFDRPGDQS
jgi:hypothetical protein